METWIIAFYIIFIVILIFCIYVEIIQYNCDSYTCSSWENALKEPTAKDGVLLLIQQQIRVILWKKSFIFAFVLTVILMWWFNIDFNCIKEFVGLFLLIFVATYLMLGFGVTHYTEPINRKIEKFIRTSCQPENDTSL